MLAAQVNFPKWKLVGIVLRQNLERHWSFEIKNGTVAKHANKNNTDFHNRTSESHASAT